MATIESTVTIARPVEEVFRFLLAPEENAPKFDPGIESVVKTSEGPTGTGTKFLFREKALGRRRETPGRFTAVEPNRKIEFEARAWPVRPAGAFRFEQTDGGTRLTFRGEPNPVGPFTLLSPLIARWGQRVWDERLARLKAVLENSAQTPR